MSYAEEFDSELDSDPDDAKKKNKANIAVALMDSTAEMDDEVEKVLGHRSETTTVACPHTSSAHPVHTSRPCTCNKTSYC